MRTTPLSPVSACQLWVVDLDQAQGPDATGPLLSEEEEARAGRFVFERDRRRYRAAHIALRHTLSSLAHIPPDALAFDEGRFGKPRLRGGSDLRFNLSHSGSVGLIVCHPNDEVGVDVEQVRPLSYSAALAEAHFSAAEQRQLRALPPPERDRAFLTGWTRKEACLKAAGFGLGSIETSAVETGVTAESARIELRGEGPPVHVELHSFACGENLVCAVAKVTQAGARP